MQSEQQQHKDEEELLKFIQEANAQKEAMERKITLAKIVNQKLTENLESTRRERENEMAKVGMLKRHVEDVVKAEQYADWHVNKIKLELKRRTALNAEVQKLIAMIHQNPLEPDIEKAEKAFSSFHADLAKAPWLPGKREIQEEFKKYRDELTKVRENIAEYVEAIAKIKEKADLHVKLPFKVFCLALANYHSKSSKICRLAKKEAEVSKQLKEKLLQVSCDVEMQESGEQNMAELGAVGGGQQQQHVAVDNHNDIAVEHQQHCVEANNPNFTFAVQQQQRVVEANPNDTVRELRQVHVDEDNQNNIVGEHQQQRVVEENTQHVNNNNNVLDLSASFLNNDGEEAQFATPVPPVSAPRCCDDGDPQPLFDFFGGATGADQSGVDSSFNFGSFINFGGPANKGQQQLQGDAPGDSQNDFNFNAFLEKPNDSNKDGTGGAFFGFFG
uniref:Uncharacterized protein n=1 Tax=Globodera pallida TaxID=36090 RepID=A0A183CG77_GLOPA